MTKKKDSSALVVGDWVIRRTNPIDGIGPYQVIKVAGDLFTVVANAQPDPPFDRQLKFRRKEIQKLESVRGISVWFPRNNHKAWEHGQVLAGGDTSWQVKIDSADGIHHIPFRNALLEYDEKSLWLKDFRSVPDPIAMLRLGMSTRIEELKTARSFRTWVNDQIQASVGFSAIMAAPVRPVHHQLNAVARVLGDPTLRFLLADEVGLGKTIEAGLILKQLLIDRAISNAVIAVPRVLKAQWRRELVTKLSLGDWIKEGHIEIVSHEEVYAELSTDLLIVDEVHRFCRGERAESYYEALEKASQKIPKLLLVSATPMRSNPYMLLQLLHLIDSRNYRLEEEVVFHNSLAMRVRQSNALRLLKPSTSDDKRRYFVGTLRENIPEDPKIDVLLATVETALTNSPQLKETIEILRTEIEERFRISRRLVRNRRSTIDQDDFPLSGREYESIDFKPDQSQFLNEFLEDWRVRSRESEWVLVEPVFSSLLEHVLGGARSTQNWISHRLEQLDAARTGVGPIFRTEKNLLEQYQILMPVSDHYASFFGNYFENQLRKQVKQGLASQKIVLCTGYTEQARVVYDSLYGKFGTRVVAHIESQSEEINDEGIQKFTSVDDVTLLVIDASAEEGLNLQVARTIINIDLPWSVNRLEQRLGRLDRFTDGHVRNAVCKVLIDKENDLLVMYEQFLCKATGIFDESVATAQQSLAQVVRELAREVWKSGVRYVDLRIDEVRERIAVEKEEVEELEEIESESSFGHFPEANFRQLQLFEEHWGQTQDVLDKITNINGGLGIHRTPLVQESRIYKYSCSRFGEARIPDILTTHVANNLSSRATVNRPLAFSNPGTEILRIGNRMIDFFEEYLYRDDIGRVSVGWVQDNSMTSPYIDFSVEVLVTPDFKFLKKLIPLSDLKRVQRRIGSAFQPILLEMRLDESANPIFDENKVWGINTRLTLGEDLIKVFSRRGSFTGALDAIEEELPSLVRERVREKLEVALELVRVDSDRRINGLKVWRAGNVSEEINLEEQIAEELDHGIRNPLIKVLSLVAVVHSYEEFS